MKILAAIILTLLLAPHAYAQETKEQVAYCASPEITAEMEGELRGFKVLASEKGPAPGVFSVNYSEVMRSRHFSGGGVTCIGVAVDPDGVAQAVHVHPKRVSIGSKARRDLLALEYEPAAVEGEPVHSIVIISIAK